MKIIIISLLRISREKKLTTKFRNKHLSKHAREDKHFASSTISPKYASQVKQNSKPTSKIVEARSPVYIYPQERAPCVSPVTVCHHAQGNPTFGELDLDTDIMGLVSQPNL